MRLWVLGAGVMMLMLFGEDGGKNEVRRPKTNGRVDLYNIAKKPDAGRPQERSRTLLLPWNHSSVTQKRGSGGEITHVQ